VCIYIYMRIYINSVLISVDSEGISKIFLCNPQKDITFIESFHLILTSKQPVRHYFRF
jgi:hypothetical protein